jgi:phenylacetate-CoA ligase
MLATLELLQEATQPGRVVTEAMRCCDEVPLYRNRKLQGFDPQLGGALRDFHTWPFITKQHIREGFPANFLGSKTDLNDLLEQDVIELEHTSGTSEVRTPLLLPRGWWAEQELRALNLNALVAKVLYESPEAKRATINSPVCSGDIRYNGVPSRENRIVGNALFVSLSRYPFLWSEWDLERMTREIMAWEPQFLEVDPVYGAVFALYCERNAIRLPSVRFVLCSYEYVSVLHRRILQRAFGVPVLDLYGSTETGHLLMEDEHGQMRPSLETAYLEVQGRDDAGIGELVVTTLSNPIMPLLRYRIGDLVQSFENPYGVRYTLHGRNADAFQLPGGLRVTTRQIDQCFTDLDGIAHYQLIQYETCKWVLRFVPDFSGPKANQLSELQQRLSKLVQSRFVVEMQQTDMLLPEQSGKFRLGYPARQTRQN